MSDTPKTDNLCLDLDDGFARQSDLIAFARDLERENDALRGELDFWRGVRIVREEDKKELIALRKEVDWKTERLKLLSGCLHNIDCLLKKAATSVFVDALDAARKEAQQ